MQIHMSKLITEQEGKIEASNKSDCMNSNKDMNLSEYMNSYNDNNDMNSSDYENSYVLPSVFVPGEELDGLTNGHDKSNTLGNTSEMNIDGIV